MDLRVKQAALLKLAQVKLAATHVLRQRTMQKQALDVKLKRTPEEIERWKQVAEKKPNRLLDTLAGALLTGSIGLAATGSPIGALASGAVGGLGGYVLGPLARLQESDREHALAQLVKLDADNATLESTTPEIIERLRHAPEASNYAMQPKAVKDYWNRLVQAYDEQYNA